MYSSRCSTLFGEASALINDVGWYLEKVATPVDGHSRRSILNHACLHVLGCSCSHTSFPLSQTDTIDNLESTGQSRLTRKNVDRW